MAQFNITPLNKVVPGNASWSRHPSSLVINEQLQEFEKLLHGLERENRIKAKLDPIDVYATKFQSESLNRVALAAMPLRKLYTREMTVSITPEWLTYWELYSRTIINSLNQKIMLRKRAVMSRKDTIADADSTEVKIRGVTYRSFHLSDNSLASVHSMQKALNHVEYSTGSQIIWDWRATYTSDRTVDEVIEHTKSEMWFGVDGDGKCTVANQRAWRNKIATSLRSIDSFVSNATELIPNVIAFALINLAIGGTALIYLPSVADAATVSLIHLFSQCFETTNIYHTVATDRLYLVGENFTVSLTKKNHSMLYDFSESNLANVDLFSQTYVQSDEFVYTVEKLTNMNHLIYNWRYDYYSRLFKVYNLITNSASAQAFNGFASRVLEEEYPDTTDQWVAATGFNFFRTLTKQQ